MIEANQPSTLAPFPLIPAIEDLIPTHFTELELTDYIERYMQTAKSFHPYTIKAAEKGEADIEMRYIRKKFTLKQTRAILDKCEKENISVHGAISAAHILAMRDISGKEEAVDISCHSPINIRPLLKPPLENSDMVSAALGYTHYQTISPEMSFAMIGESVTTTIKNCIDNGDLFKALLTVRETRLKVFLATSIGISNLGSVNLPPKFRKLKFVSINFMGRFPFAMLTGFVSTSGKKLTIMYPYAKPYYSTHAVSKLANLAEEYLLKS